MVSVNWNLEIKKIISFRNKDNKNCKTKKNIFSLSLNFTDLNFRAQKEQKPLRSQQ